MLTVAVSCTETFIVVLSLAVAFAAAIPPIKHFAADPLKIYFAEGLDEAFDGIAKRSKQQLQLMWRNYGSDLLYDVPAITSPDAGGEYCVVNINAGRWH